MRLRPPKAIIPLMRNSIIAILTIITLIAVLFSFTNDLICSFENKHQYVEQMAKLLASSASTPDGVDLVADQVSDLLNSDPTLQSIIFYSIDHPVGSNNTNQHDWRTILFADMVGVNQAVTSRIVRSSSLDRLNDGNNSDTLKNYNAVPGSALENNTLLGYISITMDVKAYRRQWLMDHKYVWFMTLILTPLSILLILRKVINPMKQFERLAAVSEEIIHNPDITQLPVIQQSVEFKEVSSIKGGLITLFNRLNEMQKEHQALKTYEQQLHSKDLSLDVQRNSFQSMITHELKTSLNAIFGGLQLLNNHYLSNEQRDALTIIRKGSEHLDSTLEQIIQLNRIEKGQVGLNPVEFNPLRLISDLMSEFEPAAKEKGLELTSQITHVDYLLEGDAGKIKLILSSLLNNAIKFTKSGTITIESHLNHFDRNTRWRVTIVDTGIGIDERYLEDIFTPFFQIDPAINREFEGVGVGLSLAKRIAQLLGASLDVESIPNEGSRFSLTLQLENWHQNYDKYLLSGIKALYYHQHQLQSIADDLALNGLDVQPLQHAQSVLDAVNKSAFDLLLISEDVSPKKAMNLAQSVRDTETTSRVLIVYLINNNERIDILESDLKASGIDYYSESSIKADKLAMLLKQWLAV